MQRKYKKMPANILSIMQTNKNRQSSYLALPLSSSLSHCRCSCLSLHNKFVKACGKRKGRKGGRMIIILRIRPGSHINTHSLSAPHTHTCMHISTVCVASTAPKSFSILQAICIFSTIVSKRPHAAHYPHIRIDKAADDERDV